MPGRERSSDIVKLLKAREAVGAQVSSKDPFPPDPSGWLPATIHPPGYPMFLAFLYRMENYSGMLWWLLRIQTVLDALTCLLVYVFVKNLFGHNAGFIAAWIYALLPGAILLCLQPLPDSLSCFFTAAILASASYIRIHRMPAALSTGAITGIACLFRAEFVIWSAIVVLLIVLGKASRPDKLRWSVALVSSQIAVLSPWIAWTYRVTGHPLLTTSGSGACMYASLGEIPNNPWGITLDDGWVELDAEKRGLPSAWTPEGDAYYHKLFLNCVRSHPAAYADMLLTQRLPLALAPAYYRGGDMWLATQRLREGLTRWQAFRKHPGGAIQHEWFKLLMAFLSAVLLGTMVYALFFYRHNLRSLAWFWVPWIVTIASVSLMKQIEARNLASNLIVEVGAVALLISKPFAQRSNTTRLAAHREIFMAHCHE
jgi:4-amino-4-deoxy-L-arabinose transferase-like glycosyltransferase